MNKTSIYVFLLIQFFYCEIGLSQSSQIEMPKSESNRTAFRNTTSSPSALKIQLLDSKTGQTSGLIIGSDELPVELAIQKGLKLDNQGRFQDQAAYNDFLKNDYFKFMEENYGKPMTLDIDLEKHKKFLFDKLLSFSDLEVQNEKELLNKYFDFDVEKGRGTLKKEYFETYTGNPAFIALLIDLGFEVYWGDYAPLLYITKNSGPRA